MAEDDGRQYSVDQLKAGIGSLILLWTKVEGSLDAAADPSGKAVPARGFRAKIDRWLASQAEAIEARPRHRELVEDIAARLTDALEIRNRIAHGVTGYRASFHPSERAGFDTDLGRSPRWISMAELEAALESFNRVNGVIGQLSRAMATDEKRAAQLYFALAERLGTAPLPG